MTIKKCKKLCSDFAYAGVQFSDECYCGNIAPTITAENCNMACRGNKEQICGGGWAMNVYSTTPCKYTFYEFMRIVFTGQSSFFILRPQRTMFQRYSRPLSEWR